MRARVVGLDGRRVQLPNAEAVRQQGRMTREYGLTFRDAIQTNERLLAGEFWPGPLTAMKTSDGVDTEVSIEQEVHEEAHVDVGDVMRFDVAGRPMYIRYDPGNATNRRAVVGVMEGMLRAARRDFTRGFKAGVDGNGPRRRLWVSRVEGTLTDAEIDRLNRLLSEAIALVMSGRRRTGARLHQLTWVSSPGRER